MEIVAAAIIAAMVAVVKTVVGIEKGANMKIGKVYAANTEDPASRDSIALGFIEGEGLLGIALEAAKKLHATGVNYGYYGDDGPQGKLAREREKTAWLELFDALKAIEAEAEGIATRIEEARYVMVGRNKYDKVPEGVIEHWLAYIEDGVDCKEPTEKSDDGGLDVYLQCEGCGKAAKSLISQAIKDELLWLCDECVTPDYLEHFVVAEPDPHITALPETEL